MDSVMTDIWQQYEKSKNYLAGEQLLSKSEKCHDFVDGDQWKGLVVPKGMDRPPQMNILQPIMKNATALVGQNSLEIVFSPLNKTAAKERYIHMCEALNKFVRDTWERLRFDSKVWNVLEDAYITGDALVYSFWDTENGEIKVEFLDNVNVFYGDENNPEIQEQPYLLIPQRKYLADVRKEAAANGLSQDEIDLIVADSNTEEVNGNKRELENDTKVTVITKMWKKDGVVCIARTTRNVVYQPETILKSADGQVTLYPIAKYSWKLRKNSARGAGDIWDKIPNQIEINKGVYRFCQAVKTNAFPHKVFLKSALNQAEIESLDVPGSSIGINNGGSVQGINNFVGYLQPGNISPYAAQLWQILIEQTRDLAGAGDNLENINPENASGTAITAAREAKALNVNGQVSAYQQFLEELAMIWADLWRAYSIEPITTEIELPDGTKQQLQIPAKDFKDLKPSVRVDLAPSTPFSRYAQEQELKELFMGGKISFEEYVDALDDDSHLPKQKLKDIIEKRKVVPTDALSIMQNGNVQTQPEAGAELIGGLGGQYDVQMPEQTML
ncbi:MAG: hypothetical protein IJN27_01680 [Oscillospiraceae bacterium]|nr:hypothetical protein [Oscillospiraceae bacterium]